MAEVNPLLRARRVAGRRAALLAAVLGLALLLRLAHWAAVRSAPFVSDLAMDSQEYDRWAREIAAGDWSGSGVFFQAPLYPYLLAILYRVAGRHLDLVYLLQIVLAVAGCYALYRAGRELAGERAGLAAAGLAAIYGPFLFYDVQLAKESLAVTVTCFLLWALAAARAHPGSGRWWAAGLLLGILSLLRENALLLAPLLLALPFLLLPAGPASSPEPRVGAFARAGLARPRRPATRAWRAAGALALGLALALAPVALRNGLLGGSFLPTTFQGGVNFYIGNNPQADGTYRPIVPGKQVPALERREPVRLAERDLGHPLSPAEVSRYWLRKGAGWALGHPADFARLELRKLAMFWSWYEWPDAIDYYYLRSLSPVYRLPLAELGGVELLAAAGLFWLRGRARAFAPALLVAGGWMAATVAFFLFARYRLPAVPALLLVAALPLAALAGSWPRRLALVALVAASLALPRLVSFAPRWDLVQFNLGHLAEERGDLQEAERHYRRALAANPRDFLVWLDLGNLAARRRDWPSALRDYAQAAALEPRSDDVQSNLLGVYLVLGRLPEARAHLARALALNGSNFQALHNGALLALRLGDLAAARDLNSRSLTVDPANPAALRLRAYLATLKPSRG